MLLKKSKKFLILVLSILMILSFSTSALAAPTSTKPTTLFMDNFGGQFMLPSFEATDYVDLRIDGMSYTSGNLKYQEYNLRANKGSLIMNAELELGVTLFINENKGIITVKNVPVTIYDLGPDYPYVYDFVGTETLNFEIKYDVTQPLNVFSFKDQNYYDEESGYYVLINDVDYKDWSSEVSPMNFSGYIFGETRQYILSDPYTWCIITHQTLVYKQ